MVQRMEKHISTKVTETQICLVNIERETTALVDLNQLRLMFAKLKKYKFKNCKRGN